MIELWGVLTEDGDLSVHMAKRLEATLITADRGLINEVKAEIKVEDIRDIEVTG